MKIAALIAARMTAAASRVLKRGSGTTYPGVIAERLHPDLIRDLSRSLPRGSIVITGTNGKTTTAKMLGDALAGAGTRLARNESGSNLRQGVASALARSTSLIRGRASAEMAVLEIDEATTSSVVPLMQPRVFCVTNLFRDQLDRHGDLDTIGSRLGNAVESAPDAMLLLNADDPLVVALSKRHHGPVAYFGLDMTGLESAASTRGISTARCPHCGALASFSAVAYDHLGAWRCDSCGAVRPDPVFVASAVRVGSHTSAFTFTACGESVRIELPVPGLHNVYNALAAASCAALCGMSLDAIVASLADFDAPFGRSEELSIDGRTVRLLLAKNPSGVEQTINSILADTTPTILGFALNDNVADGTDVSWIWDVDFEAHDLAATPIVVSGTRAEDLALRLKYAETADVCVCVDPVEAVHLLAQATPIGGPASMLATYTAMLAIRNAFAPPGSRFALLGKELRRGLQRSVPQDRSPLPGGDGSVRRHRERDRAQAALRMARP
jgi:UDP-N-acetylmuramyl tripeptide synthase